MNSDEITALIIKVLLMILGPVATKYGIDGHTTTAIATAIAMLAVAGYGIYNHWNQKLVPETATVTPPTVIPARQSGNG